MNSSLQLDSLVYFFILFIIHLVSYFDLVKSSTLFNEESQRLNQRVAQYPKREFCQGVLRMN